MFKVILERWDFALVYSCPFQANGYEDCTRITLSFVYAHLFRGLVWVEKIGEIPRKGKQTTRVLPMKRAQISHA
jgi:hypothetical protein